MMLMRHTIFWVTTWLVSASTLGAGNSNSLMDVHPDGKLLAVANPDNGSVTIVDIPRREKLSEIAVGGKLEGVTWVGRGSIVVATVYDQDRLAFIDTRAGKVIASLPVHDEPYGIVAEPEGKRAWVTHDYPGLISEVDLESRTILRTIPAGRFLRGIALAPGGDRVYVTEYFTARLHAIDLKQGRVVDGWVGQSRDNLSRHVVLNPRRPKAYLTHIRSMVDVISSRGSIFPHLTIYTLTPATTASDKSSSRRTSLALDTYNNVYVVTNPWEADVSPDGRRLYTIYAGTDDGNVSTIIDDDYREVERWSEPVRLGRNPRAVRVSPDGRMVFVYNALDFTVSFHDADMRRLAVVNVCEPPKSAEWVRGKILFNSAKQPMTNARWVACSSCHPDGGHDGRVWHNPEGLRRTTGFWGLAHTHPLHWSADRDEVQDFEFTIRGKLMAGRGLFDGPIARKKVDEPTELSEPLSGRSKDLDALAIYCNSFEFTLSPHIPEPGRLSEAAQRGQRIFTSEKTRCAECHSGPYYTDSRLTKPYRLHDVGTGNDDPTEKMGPQYDTPTLLGVYRLTAYLHHGKAKTLREVLTTYNKGDRHGVTSHLSNAEIDDLIEFLKSLPYEMPPSETPNTVPYRYRMSAKSGRPGSH
jgi:DNA-binding beta-propeller fold protein YncE